MRALLDVDLRLIRIFRAIAEAQGLSGAQLLLNLSQSRVSASLSELETRLGVRLCRRGRSGFALTEAGRSVYEASQDLFEAVDRFCNAAGTVSTRLKRVLRLGAVDALVSNREMGLSRMLRQLRRAAPAMSINFMVAGPEELEARLISGNRDVIIVPSLTKHPDLWYLTICDERQSLYCGRGHPLFAIEHVPTIDELSRHAMVARGYLHSQDLKRLGHPQAEATVEMMEGQLILILTGDFIGYLPAHYATPWVERGELRCLHDPTYGYDSTFYAVGQRSTAESLIVRRFLSVITASAEPALAT